MDGDCVGDNDMVFFCLLNCVCLASTDQMNVLRIYGRNLFVSSES